MLYRLVRPMRRKGSQNAYFEQRIPADVRERALGGKLDVPCGDTPVPITITDSGKVRFSLRTAEPSEVKVRQAEAAAYLETVWRALREDVPFRLRTSRRSHSPESSTVHGQAEGSTWSITYENLTKAANQAASSSVMRRIEPSGLRNGTRP